MTDDLTKTACRIKWPSGKETVCRSSVLVDAAASAKRVLDILGGRVLAVIDLRYRPDGYRNAWPVGAGATGETLEEQACKRMPVPLEAEPRVSSTQTDLFASKSLERDSMK